jgi:excisionase family DNA binding protein
MSETDLLSIPTAARLLGVPPKTLYEWVKAGRLGPIVEGKTSQGVPAKKLRRAQVEAFAGRALP